MREQNRKLDRRDFMKKGAQATAAAAVAAVGLNTDVACRAAPIDKKITLTSTLPARVLGKTKVELPLLGYGGAALQKRFMGNSPRPATRAWSGTWVSRHTTTSTKRWR